MASGQAVVPEEPLLQAMRGRPVITEGHRNDDCVNLAIIAWVKHGPFESSGELLHGIRTVIDEYLLDHDYVDEDYLEDKCIVLIEYLPRWARHDIWDFAIV